MKKTQKIKAYIIVRDNPDYDHEQVDFEVDGEKVRTGAYMGKREGLICFLRCPVCRRENYAMSVAEGVCAWCGYDPNNILAKETEVVRVVENGGGGGG